MIAQGADESLHTGGGVPYLVVLVKNEARSQSSLGCGFALTLYCENKERGGVEPRCSDLTDRLAISSVELSPRRD